MRDWEERRELFPNRKMVEDKPPQRPRIRPNIFAKAARMATTHPIVVLLTGIFILTAFATFAVFNFNPDFKSSVAIPAAPQVVNANTAFAQEFPQVSSLTIIRLSGMGSDGTRLAAQTLAAALHADKVNISKVFMPGIGPYYDRFGIFYLDAADVRARVRHAGELNTLFQALSASPDLSGLSALINQIANAVQSGRSPQGMEQLFRQIARTIQFQAAKRSQPLNWKAVAGLQAETTASEWVVVIIPAKGKLVQARHAVQSLLGSLQQKQPALKVKADFPQDSIAKIRPDDGRRTIVASALAILFFILLLGFCLQELRTVAFAILPMLAAAVAGFGVASFLAMPSDRVILMFLPALVLPAAGTSLMMAIALAKPRAKALTGISFIMLAAQQRGPLISILSAISIAFWMTWVYVDLASMSSLALITGLSVVAGCATTLFAIPSLASFWPLPPKRMERAEPPSAVYGVWIKLRPLFAAVLCAASLFCVVFFSSLPFGGATHAEVARGLEFMVDSEQAAAKLASDLSAVPEVGTVRWLDIFKPVDVAAKQQVLKSLSGSLSFSPAATSMGPHDLVSDLRSIESGLRVIADAAGAEKGLRASAQDFRRALAVMTNTAPAIEPAAVELEQLIFADLFKLPALAEDVANLKAPEVSDFDPDLRRLFVSDGGKWRVEILPRQIMPPAQFLAVTSRVGSVPIGPLVQAQAELAFLKDMLPRPLVLGILTALLLALAFQQKLVDWLPVVAGTLMPLPLYAGLAATTGTPIEPLALPALVIALNASVMMALLAVAKARRPSHSWIPVYLPVALVLAVVLPFQFLGVSQFAVFAGALPALLASAVVVNLVIVQMLCDWAIEPIGQNPR